MVNENKLNILVVDDEKEFTQIISDFLIDKGFRLFQANTIAESSGILDKNAIDLLILDVKLPDGNGLDFLEKIKPKFPDLEVIVISGYSEMDSALKAMRLGVFDFLKKPFRLLEIQIVIERTKKYLSVQSRLKQQQEMNLNLANALLKNKNCQFVGISPQSQKVIENTRIAAKYQDVNVLITGESGTGKENIANIIHYSSARGSQCFCKVNTTSVIESLWESEFYGHVKGSFTGAISDRAGYFEASDNGTLFLDEIGDMPLNFQAKLLRVLEEKEFNRVGETKTIRSNFRVISATNKDIQSKTLDNKFRTDLFHRLNTLHIYIPPLRERREDIQPLLMHFVNMYSDRLNKPNITISPEVLKLLKKYDFPGNVRELKNMVERAIMFASDDVIKAEDFQIAPKPMQPFETDSMVTDLKTLEIDLLVKTLKKFNYNIQLASDSLGIHRDALGRKLKKYNIKITKGQE